MAQAKKKTVKRHRKKVIPFPSAGRCDAEGGASEDELQAIQSFWQSEIEALRGNHYESFDQLLEAILDQVLGRMPQVGDDAEMRLFLRSLIESDVEIKRQLGEIFGISA